MCQEPIVNPTISHTVNVSKNDSLLIKASQKLWVQRSHLFAPRDGQMVYWLQLKTVKRHHPEEDKVLPAALRLEAGTFLT